MITINDIPTDILGDIPYFITGSVRFGKQHKYSDLDIVVCIEHRQSIYDKIEKPEPSNYNAGFKFIHNEIPINIIPLHQVDYVAWFYTAILMSKMPLINEMEKPERYGLHQAFTGILKMHFRDKIISCENYLDFCKIEKYNEITGE
jgi:hypothetical protein